MRPGPLPAAPPAARLSAPRRRLLELLQGLAEPVRLDALAVRSGLHPNTVREHLEALVGAGLVEREQAPREGRGRPAWLYAATPGPVPAPGNEYAELATALAGVVERTSTSPAEDATLAGAAWGGRLAAAAGTPPPTPAAARRGVVEVFERMGFAPRPDRSARDVRLTRCPLLEAAQASPTVVCHVHLGIVHGALDAWGHDGAGSELHPFAEPGACLLRISARTRGRG